MSMSRILDGNEAVARVAYSLSEVVAIYPITPSSAMAEWADDWAAEGRGNVWGTVPLVQQMQSEAGVVGAVHGALQTGALSTTFTASQGLLLMIPNMFKIAGELAPTVFHVAARSVATHALSIFGDHSDVMSARMTGFAMLASGSPQEAQDIALIAHASTFDTHVPFLHFFDGFRTSHEIANVETLTDEQIRATVSDKALAASRARALTPEAPAIRGTAQNPDVFFQCREASNRFYDAVPAAVQKAMDAFAATTGRRYGLFDYHGSPDAERVIVIMGSGAETVHETVDELARRGERVGVLKVRLYRPFSIVDFVRALPSSVRAVAVLDRTKEPGASGEPLYLDVVNAVAEAEIRNLKIIGGRYGLSSKEFTPAMAKAVFDELAAAKPRRHFVVGIDDDVTHLSLDYDPSFRVASPGTKACVFYGLGADGTVGANKSSIKIIGGATGANVQAYFVYDSKKSGSVTVSHLRVSPEPIRAPYLVEQSDFVGCHQFTLLEKMDVLASAKRGATFLLNAPFETNKVWDMLPAKVQRQIIDKKLSFYAVNANRLAAELGLGGRINTVMQACFFALADVMPVDAALSAIKSSLNELYGAKGPDAVRKNAAAVDEALAYLRAVPVPDTVTAAPAGARTCASGPVFVREVLSEIIAGRGDALPVSAFPADGTFPVGTSKFEKRNIAQTLPVWEEAACIQCGKCVFVCPHAAIRANVYDAPEGSALKCAPAMNRQFAGKKYTIQVAPDDCTGCGLCVDVCPAKSKKTGGARALAMAPAGDVKEAERVNWERFLDLPAVDPSAVNLSEVRSVQFVPPLFEFSGACTGCGETPYVKLLSQLFGERALIANATGCSSIYGGNLPTTPWTTNRHGRGPAWSNSLFENNAEYGLGFRLSLDKQREFAHELLGKLSSEIGEGLVMALRDNPQNSEEAIERQRQNVSALKDQLRRSARPEAALLLGVADSLVRKSVWIVGGDGWAYDIGFGGLDHALSTGRDVKALVLDTEVYSNTGGQNSKATPRGAVARFAAGGKETAKKDLGLMMMTYGNVYVASVALGARDEHTIRAFIEAERYDGPALIIAYSHCIAHGIDMRCGLRQQKLAVQSGYWPLYRFNPERRKQGLNPLQLDSSETDLDVGDFIASESRFKALRDSGDAEPIAAIQSEARARRRFYKHLAALSMADPSAGAAAGYDPEIVFCD